MTGQRLQQRRQRQRYQSTIESPDGRLERLQRRRQCEGQTELRIDLHCLRVFSFVKRKICSFTVDVEDVRLDATSSVQYWTSRDLPWMKLLW